MRLLLSLFFLILFSCLELSAQNDSQNDSLLITQNDSATLQLDAIHKKAKLKDPFWKKTVVPGVFFGLSAISWQSDRDVKKIRNRYLPDFQSKLDNYTQYAPGVVAFGLKLSGVKGRNRIGRSILNWGGGMLIMGGLVNGLKYSAKVMRPDGTTRNSFPSGHTATSFMNATFLHKEYGHINPLYSILGYTMSTYTGVSRSLNNRHWLSDILAGAGIGILSTELSYLIFDNIYKNKGDFFTSFDGRHEIENPSFLSTKMGQSFYFDLKSFEKMGLETSIEGAYFFNKKWGIGGELSFSHMPFKRESIDYLVDELEIEDISNPELDIESLGLSSLMIGGYYARFLGRKFIFQGKALAGIGAGIGGEINIKGKDNSEDVTLPFLDYSVKKTFVMGGGVSFTGLIAPTLGLSFFLDYKYANPKTKMFISKQYIDIEDRCKYSA